MPTTVYRIVESNPPSDRDLMTYEELGVQAARSDPDAARMRTGLSVFLSRVQARSKARGLPWKSRCFIAEIELSDDVEFVVEQTGRHSAKHYTLWCEASVIRASVRRIISMREDQSNV